MLSKWYSDAMSRRWPSLLGEDPHELDEEDAETPTGLELRLLGEELPPNAIIFVQDPHNPNVYWSCPISLVGEIETFEMEDGTLDADFNGKIAYHTEDLDPCPAEVLRVATTSAYYTGVATSCPRNVAVARYNPIQSSTPLSHQDILDMAGKQYLKLYVDQFRRLDGAKQDYKSPRAAG